MNIFVTADLHLGDTSALARRRDRFGSLAEMEDTIIDRWNASVADCDTVYLLGDVSKGRGLKLVRHLRGNKHLIAGNADDLSAAIKSGAFMSVQVVRWLRGVLLSHIPVHPSQLRRGMVNVHGHLHNSSIDDPRFVCVSVEQTSYSPVSLASAIIR